MLVSGRVKNFQPKVFFGNHGDFQKHQSNAFRPQASVVQGLVVDRVGHQHPEGGEVTNALDRAFCPASSNFMQLILHRKISGGNFRLWKKLTIKHKKHHQICWTIIHHRPPTFQFLTVFFLRIYWGRKAMFHFFSAMLMQSQQSAQKSQPGCPT